MRKTKILSLLVVAVLIMGLVAACATPATGPGEGDATAPTTAPPTQPPTVGQVEETDVVIEGEIGLFDPDRDYYANPRFTVEYVNLQTSVLAEQWTAAFAQWAAVSNVEFRGLTEFGGDTDALMMALPTIAARNDGLLIDADQMQKGAVAELMRDLGVPWMSPMGVPQDMEADGFPLLHPYAGFHQQFTGEMLAAHIMEQYFELWPNIPLSEFGVIFVTHSVSFALHDRVQGSWNFIYANYPELHGRMFWADTSIGFWDIDTSNDVVAAVLAMNPTIEHWLVVGAVEGQAQGATLALDGFGFTDTSAVIASGAEAYRRLMDAGQRTAWRTAGSSGFMLNTEPIFFALYAFMMGEATPETLWPEWVNCAQGERYPLRIVPYYFLTEDTYRQFFAWTDIYSGANLFPEYAEYGAGLARDSFPTRMAIPSWYRCHQPGCPNCAAAAAIGG